LFVIEYDTVFSIYNINIKKVKKASNQIAGFPCRAVFYSILLLLLLFYRISLQTILAKCEII